MAILDTTEQREAWHDRVSARMTRRMVDGLIGPPEWVLRRRLDRVLTVVLATPVHLVTAALLVVGAWLIIWGSTGLRVLGVLAVLAGVVTRPRLPPRPEHVARLERGDAPALFDVLDGLSASMGTRSPDEVLVFPERNAFATRVGLRRRALGIGAAMWVTQDHGQRLFTLGHEVGHFAHGDLSNWVYVHSAMVTVAHWLDILEMVEFPGARIALAPLTLPLTAYLLGLRFISLPSHRRSELLADLAGVRSAGTAATVRDLELDLAQEALDVAANRAAVDPARPNLAQALREAAQRTEEMRAGDRARGASQRSRVDDSHPQTIERLRLVESRPRVEASLVVPDERWRAIDAELEPHLEAALRRLGEAYRHVW